jgi:methionine S-methyltransferase
VSYPTSSHRFPELIFIYSVSQGFVEDQFGLGLIARALEESIQVIKPSGSIIMNMGGRPGQAVLERLYERRGFNIRKVRRLTWKPSV